MQISILMPKDFNLSWVICSPSSFSRQKSGFVVNYKPEYMLMVEMQRYTIDIDLAIAAAGSSQAGVVDAERIQQEYLVLAEADPRLELPIRAVIEVSKTRQMPPDLYPIFTAYGLWYLDPKANKEIISNFFDIEPDKINPLMYRLYDEVGLVNLTASVSDTIDRLSEQKQFAKLRAPRHKSLVDRGSRQERQSFRDRVLFLRQAGNPCAKVAEELGRPLTAVQEASRALIRKGLLDNRSNNNPRRRVPPPRDF